MTPAVTGPPATASDARPASHPAAPPLAPLVAATLTAAGLHVSGPDPDDPDADTLAIECPLARCLLTVNIMGTAELDWAPLTTAATDPHHVADLAAALLAGPPHPRHPDAKTTSDITYKGIIGMDLRAAGYAVTLDIHADDYYYDVTADIKATNPRAPTAGTIYITDQGGLTWHRHYWDTRAEPAPLPDPPATARAIAATITHALTSSHEQDPPASLAEDPIARETTRSHTVE